MMTAIIALSEMSVILYGKRKLGQSPCDSQNFEMDVGRKNFAKYVPSNMFCATFLFGFVKLS